MAVPLVDIIGEFDLNSTLAQMQNARYTPESAGRVDSRSNSRQGTETLSVLTTLPEVRAAVNEIASSARRLISIYTPDLEPDLYDQTSFLEVIKHWAGCSMKRFNDVASHTLFVLVPQVSFLLHGRSFP